VKKQYWFGSLVFSSLRKLDLNLTERELMYIGFNEKTNFKMMSISKEVPSLDSAFAINICKTKKKYFQAFYVRR
jgi:hypothetical protein